MNTYTETGESHYTGGAWSAFVVGAAIGAAAALILAPARGRDTRAYLKQRGNELGRDAMQRGRETWREQSERVKSAISTGWERANDAMHQALPLACSLASRRASISAFCAMGRRMA